MTVFVREIKDVTEGTAQTMKTIQMFEKGIVKTDELNTKSFPEVTYPNTLQSAFGIIRQGQDRKKAGMLKLSAVSCFFSFFFSFFVPQSLGGSRGGMRTQ